MMRQTGFTFIGLMVIISISGIILAAVGTVWQQNVQREREQDLLYLGDQYRRAITQYYDRTPSGVKQFPKKLSDLLIDNRFPIPQHHLRALYENPISTDGSWQLIKLGGRIKGVSTDSSQTPIKVSGFPERYKHFEEATTYADWQFIYQDESNTAAQSGSPTNSNPFKQ